MKRMAQTDRDVRAVAGRRRWNTAQAKVILNALDRSGMPMPAFCQKNNLSYHRVQQWDRKRRSGDERLAAEAMLLPLRVVDDIGADDIDGKGSGCWAVEIELGGCRIRVAEGASESVVKRALRAAREQSC